jgi:hypothetical protein
LTIEIDDCGLRLRIEIDDLTIEIGDCRLRQVALNTTNQSAQSTIRTLNRQSLPQSTIRTLNPQSAPSIRNPHPQSAIDNRKIRNPQSPIRNS